MKRAAFPPGWKPEGRPDVLMRASRDQRMLYDSGRDRIHILNETAEFIWQLCDGEHTVAEMVTRLRLAFDVPGDIDLETDVEKVLTMMIKKDLLVAQEEDEDAAGRAEAGD